tara:strand:+ start:46 stop:933 length:888 start_codon:yes stop_codon:yes gene_type:complete
MTQENTNSNSNIKLKIDEFLDEFKNNEFKNIKKEIEYNRDQPYAFTELGGVGEELALKMYPKYIGSASKGGCAFDIKLENEDRSETIDAKEVKMISLDGSKKCKNCNRKAPRFQLKCLKCEDSNFEMKSDSRAGISASAHCEYIEIISEYIIMACKYNDDKNCIWIIAWKIKSNNEYFNDYITNQCNNGKGDTVNCLPGSMDFHLSGPIKLFEYELYENKLETIFFNLDNNNYEDIPKYNFNTSHKLGYKYTDPQFKKIFDDIDSINYLENIDKFVKKSGKKTTLGKERGTTTRK